MTRIILSLEEQDKAWLEQQAAEQGVSMAAVIRSALRSQRKKSEPSLEALLAETRGTWKSGDGLKYQRRVRGEWR